MVETAPVAAGPAITSIDDLADVLKSAGLVLAATDPVKLQAAQAAAANTAEAPRVRRERKVVPVQAEEPLVQIETQR
ncbi:RNase E: endoribonuclease for rRNA processing and mRNA degradation [Oxalobacteraceae bacterium IMCC9480]|nr:RNase E: endoribonuclease for rRNA processing and mRNA degradation [Oxalobacteraceae bacterium IMCC9480]